MCYDLSVNGASWWPGGLAIDVDIDPMSGRAVFVHRHSGKYKDGRGLHATAYQDQIGLQGALREFLDKSLTENPNFFGLSHLLYDPKCVVFSV